MTSYVSLAGKLTLMPSFLMIMITKHTMGVSLGLPPWAAHPLFFKEVKNYDS